jgi:NADH:ubiquinone oxidoreductase subunit 2 (subunit N)
MPEAIVCLAGVIVMLVDAFARPHQRWLTGSISLAGLTAAAVSAVSLWISGSGSSAGFNGMIVLDEFHWVSRLSFCFFLR